jgi:hypothetical protein
MNGRARALTLASMLVLAATPARAQVDYRETPAPLVTAERESWYLAGEPVMYAGQIYYPAGPQVHFRANEMVRSGFYMGIPLYTRTTIEPYSIVYLPLSGGLMQPYERRRAGDIAGTVGSTTPSFPVVRSSEERGGPLDQAPAPPIQSAEIYELGTPVGTVGRGAAAEPPDTGTEPAIPAPAISPERRARTANGLFVPFDGKRWFSDGPAVAFEPSHLRRIGEYRGFPVYADRRRPGTIFIPVTRDAGSLVARYSLRPAR